MPTDHRAALAKIKRFDQLIAYLRDEMGWPIARDSFEDVDDLFYDFTADELGIDPKTAAKIESIKRLRPLSPNQPWGIFFVKFEPKKLPVIALRRILNQVALKKRASANSAERATWAADDLLFISNYGEGDERQISFAHFSKPADGHDLPTLKVLGWDNLDTALHLDAVAKELTKHLTWPEDDADVEAWRQGWRAAFTLRHREVITTSKDLSIRLAELARAIRDRIKAALTIETETGSLTKLMKAFKEALVHDLDADGFADMYAQTIAYGLLSARIADPGKKTADDFAAHMRTNPFLRELMETFLKVGGRRGKAGGPGIDFDELGVSEVVELLDDANMEAVVRDFDDRNPREDPVIHFYEHFLAAYDKKQKVSRGVFYTPRPVVSYIVRSVDELLRTEFGLADGLADTTSWGEMAKRHMNLKIPEKVSASQAFVQILDPATGTGTFLVEVIDLVHKTLVAKWQAQGHGEKKIEAFWNEYVPKHLLPRLHGYELLMAPYAIAHLKVGLKLYETGYRFSSDERARIFLTNALEPPQDYSDRLAFDVPALAHEAKDVNAIKRHQRFTVIMGNPPYAGHSINRSRDADGELTFIGRLIEDYKIVDGQPLGERQPKWLQDDYVKFIRFAQYCLNQSMTGMLGFITNNGYLDNPTFRGMRQSLMQSFPFSYALDLHGNTKKKEKAPDGGDDQNVFDIQQGVALLLAVSASWKKNVVAFHYASIWGKRQNKYHQLSNLNVRKTDWAALRPTSPFYLLIPQDVEMRDEYEKAWKITEIMPSRSVGFVTARDSFLISLDKNELLDRLEQFRTKEGEISTQSLKDKFGLKDTTSWNLREARRDLRNDANWKDDLTKCAYRPFDSRLIYYSDVMLERPVRQIQRHMVARGNLAFGCSRQQSLPGMWRHIFVTNKITESCFVSNKTAEINYIFPLWLLPEQRSLALSQERQINMKPEFIKVLAQALSLAAPVDGQLPRAITPEDFFHYAYAVFNSLGYRSRYAEFLKIDFPRLPLTGSLDCFREMARLGGELVAFHLLESPKLDKLRTEFIGSQNPEVEKISWSNQTVWIDKDKSIGFKDVQEAVWDFQIGSYQVCEKWLKDRKGRTLSKDDIAHYQKIVVALTYTIRLMKEIDEVIDAHGGWPGAFLLKEQKTPALA
jgi:predicted helicase